MPIKDSLIAATALVHDLTVVTRNRIDFDQAGVRIIDPLSVIRNLDVIFSAFSKAAMPRR